MFSNPKASRKLDHLVKLLNNADFTILISINSIKDARLEKKPWRVLSHYSHHFHFGSLHFCLYEASVCFFHFGSGVLLLLLLCNDFSGVSQCIKASLITIEVRRLHHFSEPSRNVKILNITL